jgi:hypothetical protein
MNKWQLICPMVAIALVAIFGLAGQGRRNHRYYVSAQTRMIGQDLIKQTNSSRLVRIGPGLQDRLSGFLAAPSGVADALLGDEPHLGDGSACSRLVLSNAVGERLGIQLRQDSEPEKFHVLGYWTIAEPSGAVDGSQPFRPGTNQVPGAAGSRR